MAMNIGEIKHGTLTLTSDNSTRVEHKVDWYAERTSETTTKISVGTYHKLIGTKYGYTSGEAMATGEKIVINNLTYRPDYPVIQISTFDAGEVAYNGRVVVTITHGAEGLESFNLNVSGTWQVKKSSSTVESKAYSLSTQTINLSSATTVKILEGQPTTYESYGSTTTYGLKTIYSVVQSVSNNYSDVTAKLYISLRGDYSLDFADIRVTHKVNGTSNTACPPHIYAPSGSGVQTPSSSWEYNEVLILLNSITTRVYHDDEGKKEINFYGTLSALFDNSSYNRTNITLNLNEALPDIPRAATILTAPNFSDEDNPTITYSNPAGSLVTSLQAAISLDGSTANISWRDVSKTGVSYTFNLTDDERNTLRAAASSAANIQVAFLLKTVLGGNTFIESAQRTLSIVSCNPVLDSTVIDTNATTVALTGDSSKLVKFYSNAQASLNVTLVKGATLAYFEIKNGANYGNTQVFTFNNVENNKFEFLARDSRGNIATKVVTPTMVEYIKLTCNLANNLPDTSGNYDINVTGNYFNGSFGAVNNTLTVQYRIKTENGSYGSWITMATTLFNGTYEATARATGLDYRLAYVVQIKAADKITEITTDERKVKTTPVFSWSNDDFEFNTEVRINGDLRLKGDGNYGNTLYFGDGSYAYMTEATDDDLTFHSTDLTLDATNLYLNGSSQVKINGSVLPNIETGTWDAVLGSSAAVSSYNSRSGWYIKIGNVVTIGWNIDATCNSGYQSTTIKIAGAPYFPSVSAAGGGILYGAYATAGFAFEGWVIEESGGAITPRLQPCNNTAAANLNISSTAYYPTGGGNLKCFGSLTYTTDD